MRSLLRKRAFATIGLALGLIILVIPVPQGLSRQAMFCFGVMVWSSVYLAAGVLPHFVTSMLMCLMWLLVLEIPASSALGAFSGETVWLIIGSLLLARAMEKTTFVDRLVNALVRTIPREYPKQVLLVIGVSTLIGALIPDAVAKVTLLSPIGVTIARRIGYSSGSPEAYGLTMGVWTGLVPIGTLLFMTASPPNLVILSSIGEMGRYVSWTDWTIAALPLTMSVGVFQYLALLSTTLSRHKQEPPDGGKPRTQSADDESVARSNRDTLVILVLVTQVAFWVFGGNADVEPAWITLAAVSLLFISGALEREDLISGVDWGLVLYMGFIMSLGPVLNSVGAQEWLQATIASAFGSVMQNVYLFLTCVVLLVFVLRIMLANLVTPGILTALLVGPLAERVGVHPLIVVLIAVGAGALWMPQHISPMYLAFNASLRRRSFSDTHLVRLNLIFMASVLLGVLVCVPWWKMLGLIAG